MSGASWTEVALELGLRLQRRRTELGLSQERLAHSAGITRNYYRLLERGLGTGPDAPANPTIKVLARLSTELALPLEDLIPDFSKVRWQD